MDGGSFEQGIFNYFKVDNSGLLGFLRPATINFFIYSLQ
jgi:hypothetical protein